jgi:hypothetical protein
MMLNIRPDINEKDDLRSATLCARYTNIRTKTGFRPMVITTSPCEKKTQSGLRGNTAGTLTGTPREDIGALDTSPGLGSQKSGTPNHGACREFTNEGFCGVLAGLPFFV